MVSGVEIRGSAVALSDVEPPVQFMSCEVIRVTPNWIASWGLDPDMQGRQTRRGAEVTSGALDTDDVLVTLEAALPSRLESAQLGPLSHGNRHTSRGAKPILIVAHLDVPDPTRPTSMYRHR